MFRINYFCIIVLSLHLFSCKNDAPKVPAESNVVSVKSPITELTQPEIPGVPQHVMERLLNQCTFIDYIFHDYTFSVSQAEDSDIDQNISFIDFNKPIGKMITGCKPMARKFFQINGKIEFDVDVISLINAVIMCL